MIGAFSTKGSSTSNHGNAVSSTWMWRNFQSVQQFMSQALQVSLPPTFTISLAQNLRKKIYTTTYLFQLQKWPIFCDLFGMVKWPFKRLSDLQLRDQKVTLNHLEEVNQHTSPWKILVKMNQVSDFIQWNPGCSIGNSYNLDINSLQTKGSICHPQQTPRYPTQPGDLWKLLFCEIFLSGENCHQHQWGHI